MNYDNPEPTGSNLPRTLELPILAIRNTVIFPVLAFPINVGRTKSLRAIERALEGVEGLETVIAADDELAELEDDMPSLFDHYLNMCPNQGSRTIRTEEALLVGLSALKPHIERAGE